jgi:hypothetical protein
MSPSCSEISLHDLQEIKSCNKISSCLLVVQNKKKKNMTGSKKLQA